MAKNEEKWLIITQNYIVCSLKRAETMGNGLNDLKRTQNDPFRP